VDKFSQVLTEIKKLNPDIHIVFTVSPVRHWKDGPVNNQLSKSVLILAVHELVKRFSFVSYFPSYEIMMDDLRDYRFYADDLFHPNQLGIDYIWLKFRNTFVSEKAIEISEKIDKLNKALAHKPFYPNTLAYKSFIDNNLKLIKDLELLVPGILFKEEVELLLSEKENIFPKR
jgi:hypothetical protein